jgi:carbamoyl-phosphate synthase large subunit
MRSTGEVMGLDVSPGLAFLKAQLGAGMELSPETANEGLIFLSLADRDKKRGMELAQSFAELGFGFIATTGTAAALADVGIEVVEVLSKLRDDGVVEPAGRTVLDSIAAGEVALVINTPRGRGARADGSYIRTAASINNVPLITTVAAAKAISVGLAEWVSAPLVVRSLQSVRAGSTG